jgi:hypothetical protein
MVPPMGPPITPPQTEALDAGFQIAPNRATREPETDTRPPHESSITRRPFLMASRSTLLREPSPSLRSMIRSTVSMMSAARRNGTVTVMASEPSGGRPKGRGVVFFAICIQVHIGPNCVKIVLC